MPASLYLFVFFFSVAENKRDDTMGKITGIFAGSVALFVMIVVGIGCHKNRKRKTKLNALLSKRYGSTFHFILLAMV